MNGPGCCRLRRACLLACLGCLAAWAGGAEDGEASKAPALFPIREAGKWGYMDQAGKIVVPPQYDCAWDYSDGMAWVQKDLLRGALDASGRMVIQPQFALAWDFSDGRAAVFVGAQKWGSVMNIRHNGRWGFIDKSGNLLGKAQFAWARESRGGWAAVHDGPAGRQRWGLLGKDGKCGLAVAHAVGDFSDGMVAVRAKNRWGYADQTLKFVIEERFDEAGPFSDGLAPVAVTDQATKTTQWGFIDKQGQIVIEMKFEGARRFSEGLASVEEKGKWGYLDKTGKTVIEQKFDYAAPFSEGLGRVVVGGKHGFIDRAGKPVVAPAFELAQDFSGGLARVEAERKLRYIDKKGQVIWQESTQEMAGKTVPPAQPLIEK